MKKLHFLHLDFWKASKAVWKLEEGFMSNEEKHQYFFIGVIIWLIISEFMIRTTVSPGYSGLYDVLTSCVNAGLLLAGLVYLNFKHTSEVSFLDKLIVVVVASMPRFILILYIPFIFIIGFLYTLVYGNTIPNQLMLLVLFGALKCLYFYLLGKYFVTHAE